MNAPRPICVLAGVALSVLLTVSCSSTPPLPDDAIFEDEASQLQIRSNQTRMFDTADRIKILRAVIATLQDLDFVIDQADSRLGVVTATRMSDYLLSATVMVSKNDSSRLLVRARMQSGWLPGWEHQPRFAEPVSAETYQEFFYSLTKNMSRAPYWR